MDMTINEYREHRERLKNDPQYALEWKQKQEKNLQEKIGDIKKRKRALRHFQDTGIVKKMKKDLKKEYRNAKHAEKNEMKKWLKDEVNKHE